MPLLEGALLVDNPERLDSLVRETVSATDASDRIASYDAEHHEVTKRCFEAGIARFVSSAESATMLAPS